MQNFDFVGALMGDPKEIIAELKDRQKQARESEAKEVKELRRLRDRAVEECNSLVMNQICFDNPSVDVLMKRVITYGSLICAQLLGSAFFLRPGTDMVKFLEDTSDIITQAVSLRLREMIPAAVKGQLAGLSVVEVFTFAWDDLPSEKDPVAEAHDGTPPTNEPTAYSEPNPYA